MWWRQGETWPFVPVDLACETCLFLTTCPPPPASLPPSHQKNLSPVLHCFASLFSVVFPGCRGPNADSWRVDWPMALLNWKTIYLFAQASCYGASSGVRVVQTVPGRTLRHFLSRSGESRCYTVHSEHPLPLQTPGLHSEGCPWNLSGMRHRNGHLG